MAKKKVAKKKVAKKKVAKKATSTKAASAPAAKGKGYPPFKEKKNIGNYAKELIMRGKSSEEIVESVKSKFPDSSIKPAAVGYYRQALKKEGYTLPG